MAMLSEFKAFIARGNVLDLAVGVIIGAAFGAIVTVLAYGSFVTSVINFLILAFIIFLIVREANRFLGKKEADAAPPAGPSEVELLTEIRDALKK
jgi:large conductance mechanosensitive channel